MWPPESFLNLWFSASVVSVFVLLTARIWMKQIVEKTLTTYCFNKALGTLHRNSLPRTLSSMFSNKTRFHLIYSIGNHVLTWLNVIIKKREIAVKMTKIDLVGSFEVQCHSYPSLLIHTFHIIWFDSNAFLL